MEATVNASIEPELQSPPPRVARRRPNYAPTRQNGCAAGCLMPHVLIGLGIGFLALLRLAVLCFGVIVPAIVTDKTFHSGSKGSVSYYTSYHYRLNGTDYNRSTQVSGKDYSATSNGQTVSVRVLPSMAGTGEILFTPGGSRLGSGFALFPYALCWNGAMLLLFTLMFGPARLQKSLVKRGLAVRGRVVRKEMIHGKARTYYVHYEYTPSAFDTTRGSGSIGPWASSAAEQALPETAASGGLIQAKMSVPLAQFDAIKEGDEMTVLFSPKKPSKSVLYAASGYVAVA